MHKETYDDITPIFGDADGFNCSNTNTVTASTQTWREIAGIVSSAQQTIFSHFVNIGVMSQPKYKKNVTESIPRR